MPLNLALALACLLGPADVAMDAPPAPLSAFQTVALHKEWMDQREERWCFATAADFRSDLRRIQERVSQLWDAPPLCDAARFPSRDFCCLLLAKNRQYRAWLEARQRLDSSEWITEALGECDLLWSIWDECRDAQTEYYYVYIRRVSLSRLRELIGDPLYYAGCLPAHVPVWRFQRID